MSPRALEIGVTNPTKERLRFPFKSIRLATLRALARRGDPRIQVEQKRGIRLPLWVYQRLQLREDGAIKARARHTDKRRSRR